MCLITYRVDPYTYDHPIKCFKVIKNLPNIGRMSLFQNYVYPDKLEGVTIVNDELPHIEVDSKECRITSGYFHACISHISAIGMINSHMPNNSLFEIWECEIPAKVDFFIGIAQDICSEELKFIQRLL